MPHSDLLYYRRRKGKKMKQFSQLEYSHYTLWNPRLSVAVRGIFWSKVHLSRCLLPTAAAHKDEPSS